MSTHPCDVEVAGIERPLRRHSPKFGTVEEQFDRMTQTAVCERCGDMLTKFADFDDDTGWYWSHWYTDVTRMADTAVE
jgi:hypothetical protein